jgi:hypothetical protein
MLRFTARAQGDKTASSQASGGVAKDSFGLFGEQLCSTDLHRTC